MNVDYCSNIRNKMYEIKDMYGITPETLSKSILGHGIYSISIGDKNSANLIVGGVHGITGVVLMMICEDLLSIYQGDGSVMGMSVRKILENKGVIIIPCLNPDSLENHDDKYTSLNGRNIDIAKNFETNWNDLKDGDHPFSEPESICLGKICFEHNIRHLTSLQFGKKNINYGYKDLEPQTSRLMAELMISDNDYKLHKPNSTFCINNWYIKTFRKPAFAINLSKNDNLVELYQDIRDILFISLLL